MTVYDDRKLHPEWARCRSSNHWMDWIPSDPTARRNGTIPVWYRCVECGTERYDELDATTLDLVARRYRYPEGYVVHGEGRPTRGTWRAAYLRAVGAISDRQAAQARRYRKELWQETGNE